MSCYWYALHRSKKFTSGTVRSPNDGKIAQNHRYVVLTLICISVYILGVLYRFVSHFISKPLPSSRLRDSEFSSCCQVFSGGHATYTNHYFSIVTLVCDNDYYDLAFGARCPASVLAMAFKLALCYFFVSCHQKPMWGIVRSIMDY